MNSYGFVNGFEMYKYKTKDSEMKAAPLCLGNVSKSKNMKRTTLYKYVYDLSVGYDCIDVDRFLEIH